MFSFWPCHRMEEEPNHGQRISSPPSSSSTPISIDGPSTFQVEEESEQPGANEEGDSGHDYHHSQEQLQQQQQQQRQSSIVSYRLNIAISDVTAREIMRDDVWSCLIVLVTFCFFASMTLILGYYGSVSLQLGPNCSRLIQTNSFFVQSIKAKEMDGLKPGPMLYGFYKPPPLDVEITWNQTHMAVVPIYFHKAWVYFLNEGSKLDIFYSVKSSSPVSLVIAQGRESLAEWIDDPSYPNTTLSWNIICGSGKIQQEISKSSDYYIAVGNLNSEDAEVELKFTVKAFIYNTTQAYYSCSLGNYLCSLRLFLLRTSVAVLSSPGPEEGALDDDWYVRLSYGPRWVTYIVGSGFMTALILLAFRSCNMFQTSGGDVYQAGEVGSEQAPLLSHKDDDISSWGSSYDYISHEEEDVEEWLAVNSLEGKPLAEGDNPRSLCVICFDAPRNCFFLPCGHCAACFACGTRIAEEAGTCPICRRSMKKVRKIFTV